MGRHRSWKRKFNFKLKKEALFSISYILLFLIAFIIALSFSRKGEPLVWVNSNLMEILGWGTFYLVFFLILSGLMMTKIKVPWSEARTLAGSVSMILPLMGITKTGLVGREIFQQVSYFLTPIGAYFILFCISAIGFVVFFNTSFDSIFIYIYNFLKSIFDATGQLSNKRKNEAVLKEKINEKIGSFAKAVIPGGDQGKSNHANTVPDDNNELSLSSNMQGGENVIWTYPPYSLLSSEIGGKADRGDVKKNANIIEDTFENFGIKAPVVDFNSGPAVTQYAVEVAPGTKLSKITSLADDLASALSSPTGQIRIEAPIPGKSLVGIELPNRSPETVTLKQILTSEAMKSTKNKLLVPLGMDVSNTALVANIAKMPHVLIAGMTGSGKSVLLNSWIVSLLFRASPSEVRLILIDPKGVEFTQYNGVPHLLVPVITESKKIVSALKWAVTEMEKRYKSFAEIGARNIDAYNEQSGFQRMPYVVIILDELAQVIMSAPAEVEDNICRLAQMARATGIHLVISTQRPSVNVLTGLIKANIPCRISFAVPSMIDSRVIIDSPGAEKLLGRGDMLYIPPDQAKPTRIQGAFVSDKEIHGLIDFIKKTGVRPVYTDEVTELTNSGNIKGGGAGGEKDELFEDAIVYVSAKGKASSSMLQTHFSIGYNRAAKIINLMEEVGAIGPANGAKPRDLLFKDPQEVLSKLGSN